LHQEYPNHISHTLGSAADARPPRELTPAFYGCYDWHSAVHGHWLLVRLLRLFPDAPFASRARAEVSRSLTVPNISAEVAYLRDRSGPLAYEPSGEDFLSPCLAEADFMRRALGPRAFARWLSGFLAGLPAGAVAAGRAPWLSPAVVTDRADPKLAHLDGLNLSRAWMLQGIAHGLPPHDGRIAALLAAAARHRDSALPAVTGEHYEGGHWLGTFAVYLTSAADLRR